MTRCKLFPLVAAFLLLVGATAAVAQPTVEVFFDPDVLQGANPEGNPLLYAPQPFQQGSSVSHFDPTAQPSLLMEPRINADLAALDLDITPALMADIGWPIFDGDNTPLDFRILAPPDADGFSDPRPFTPEGGNDATTLGEARLNAFQGVLSAWAATLSSDVVPDVLVAFTPLPCGQGGAALAAAGPTRVFANFPGAVEDDTWFPNALAESLSGDNLSGDPIQDPEGAVDIVVFVNSEIDNECLGAGTRFYYGLDGEEPANQIDFAPTVLHELGHGLGFTSLTSGASGARIGSPPDVPLYPAIWEHFVHDDTTGKLWLDMTNAERRESAVNDRFLSWKGAGATAAAGVTLDGGTPRIGIDSDGIDGEFPVQLATFGPPITEAPIEGEVACLRDGVLDPSPFNACSPVVNPGDVAGKVALVDRGQCTFATKAFFAQLAGATGVIVSNNAGNSPPPMGGVSPDITIPSVGVSHDVGNALRQAACPGDAAFVQEDDRFQISATWETVDGATGPAKAVPVTEDTAGFYFFGKNNVEIMVKVLDACNLDPFNNYWAFSGGLTDVGVTITVTDTQTGQSKIYDKPVAEPFVAIRDTEGFDTCP